ncbi:MAG: Lrp/AsnC family transcriptional regulator [Thermoplasmata archaeon]|jgi:DNA-binding Lrp family transcriptional regulator|nr:Lrp/AsnC family transcriptional regulator [Thermoplasmata archaeon]MVT14311.1 winged helix-turn-helix transcriptional regulator [Euryarchaeota archaeon]MVT36408.1 winged helix-turn-helix transcriptional regulator [Euryarchaeota archaeon]
MNKVKLDKLNLDIIELLENDCSLTYRDIAKILDKNLWTVRERIDNLKRKGVIKGCKAKIDYTLINLNCKAYLFFNLPPDRIDDFINFAKTQKMVKKLTIISGEKRFIAEIVGETCSFIRDYIKDNFVKYGIYNTSLEIVLDEPIN